MLTPEKHSLEAISQLESEFPYAATLLVYVVLERCLKLYLFQNRKVLSSEKLDLDVEVKLVGKKAKFNDFRDHDDAAFRDKFLLECPLGSLEKIFKIQDRKYSSSRNNVFHSNLYISDQITSDESTRDAENRKYLKTAKEHLIEASTLYFHQKIIESNGRLQFES